MRVRVPLSAADAYLQAVERMMVAAGQGQHWGVTILQLGAGFAVEGFRQRVSEFARESHIACAHLRHPWGRLPVWEWRGDEGGGNFPVQVHQAGVFVGTLCHARLNGESDQPVLFDIVPGEEGTTTLLMTWRHALLDGKGAELLLAELARDPAAPGSTVPVPWGPARARRVAGRQFLQEARRFKTLFNAQAQLGIASLAGRTPQAGTAEFALEHFTREETRRMAERAHACTQGLFMLPWFLAVAVRVHRAVHQQRGMEPESYQASCAVQERKRGARGPIWQNQVSQLFFCLRPGEAADLATATRALQEQFRTLTQARMQEAFATMAGLLRRLPSGWYLRFLRRHSGGHLTSFFHSYTGTFLPECQSLAGAPILDGWHIPSVSAPPARASSSVNAEAG